MDRASRACDRIETGLKALEDPQVLEAFKLMNRVIAIGRRRQLSQKVGQPPESFEAPSWRPFQLAFILLNLGGLANPETTTGKSSICCSSPPAAVRPKPIWAWRRSPWCYGSSKIRAFSPPGSAS